MDDNQILSVPRPVPSVVQKRQQLFDACHIGVALRAVLLVELVLAVAALFGSVGFENWLTELAWLTGAALPATLAWLAGNCLLLRLWPSLPRAVQQFSGVLLGALAGLAANALLVLAQLLSTPFWVASAASGALLAAALVALLSLRERGKTPASTAARLAELQSRIRPHFLFNTLNSAIALVRAEPARAEALLEDLSELFRHALAEQAQTITLGQEIAMAQRYLAIEQVRFGQRVQVSWKLDPRAEAALLPPLLLQPLVENAVRHGVEPSVEGAHIEILTQRKGSRVLIQVRNSMPAGEGAHGQGVALENVRQRLFLLHDLQADFRSGGDQGFFEVRIEVPA